MAVTFHTFHLYRLVTITCIIWILQIWWLSPFTFRHDLYMRRDAAACHLYGRRIVSGSLNFAFSRHFSTFYEPSVQAMDTQLGALHRRRVPVNRNFAAYPVQEFVFFCRKSLLAKKLL